MVQPELDRSGGGGTIHDIGYRGYDGPRAGTGAIGRSLFVTGLLNAYGFGRSGKSKVLPFILLGIAMVPAIVSVGIMTIVSGGLGQGFIDYSVYSNSVSLLIYIFLAAQAPVLFSRDLRSGVIALYLARPLGAGVFAFIRWASLATAMLIFCWLPVIVLFVGAVAAGADVGEQLPKFLAASVGIVLLAAVLSAFAGVLSAYTPRRGLAIGATIIVLLVADGVMSIIKAVASESEQPREALARWSGLVSPSSTVDGIQVRLLDGTGAFPFPPATGEAWVFLLVALTEILLGIWLIVRRYRKAGSR